MRMHVPIQEHFRDRKKLKILKVNGFDVASFNTAYEFQAHSGFNVTLSSARPRGSTSTMPTVRPSTVKL